MALSRTPLRYPGGKQRLSPFLIEILKTNNLLDCDYVEPYAGGAGAALELLLTRKVRKIHLNDSSLPVYSFWKAVLNYTDEFCRLISSASLTIDEWRRQKDIIKNPADHDELTLGFSTFYLNRVNRSGVISGGIIGGINQDGNWKMDARFSRFDLIQRIESIAYRQRDIAVTNMDAEVFIKKYLPKTPERTLVYFDPPYFEKSEGLYLNDYIKKDHERLALTIQNNVNHKWILSYDGHEKILSYYKQRKFFIYDLQYNAQRIYKGKEVFIFCDDLRIPSRSSLPYINIELNKLNNAEAENVS